MSVKEVVDPQREKKGLHINKERKEDTAMNLEGIFLTNVTFIEAAIEVAIEQMVRLGRKRRRLYRNEREKRGVPC